MGDLDLRREIRSDFNTGVVHHQRRRGPVRCMYSARIHGSKSKMTVTIYEEDNSEEEWREAISRYSSIPHPSVMQLFAAAKTSAIHATIFHDELIPAQQILEERCHVSPIYTVYFWQFLAPAEYVASVSDGWRHKDQFTLWIRPSTGGLCVDLTPNDFVVRAFFGQPVVSCDSFLDPSQHREILNLMSLSSYHISALHSEVYHQFSISPGCSNGSEAEDSAGSFERFEVSEDGVEAACALDKWEEVRECLGIGQEMVGVTG
ncbi:hypothetical protein B0H17DRAFT_1134012 [Mycena rosella]|uniref:Uncharacterized protein n=1 Tax=Mycena rosella TaxID=1033263 RepID=A0AAD7DGP6_MYCRO|nr:hypothetical protein B0H17DRAFT_1134012 [Mycena rosella]